jgi:hypothetical protein
VRPGDLAQQRHTVGGLEAIVREDRIKLSPGKRVYRGGGGGDEDHVRGAEHPHERAPERRIIVHHEDTN